MLVPLTAGLAIGGYIQIHNYWAQSTIDAELQAIRAAGEPLTPEELDAMADLPPGVVNVADSLSKAFDILESDSFEEEKKAFPYVGEPKFDPITSDIIPPPLPGEPFAELEQAEAFLNKHEAALAALLGAADAGGNADFNSSFTKGLS